MTIGPDLEKSAGALVASAADAHLLVTPEGIVAYANDSARTVLDATQEELIGSLVTGWLDGIDPRSVGTASEIEAEGVSAAGDRFPAEVSVTPVGDDSSRSWVIVRDISRRKGFLGSMRQHAEELEQTLRTRSEELAEAHAAHQKLYDVAPILDFKLDSQNSISSANRKACVTLGVVFDRLVGLPMASLAVPESRADLQEALDKARVGSLTPFETRLRGANGNPIDVVFHSLRSTAPRPSSLRLQGLDVTARREAERLVDQSLDLAEAQRARMERILRGIGEGLVVTDPDGQIRLMNSIAEEILGVPETLAFGRDLFSDRSDPEFVRVWQEFTAGSDDRAVARYEKDPNHVYSATFSRIHTPEGRPAGCVAVLADVTRERRGDRMKRDFVANITNELRTPLASIRGFISTILRGENRTREDNARFLTMIEKESERLQHLVEDLLSLASLEAGRESLNYKPANLADMLQATHEMFAGTASERGITFELRGAGQNGAGIFDADKVRRIADNLVGNAMKFTPAGGRIDLVFSREDDRLQCAVRDTGPGIERHRLEKIFDRFDTVASTGNPWGTGLGLHIVRGLVELHGGEIVAESKLGEGSTFRFWIPSVPDDPKKPTADEAPDFDDPFVDDPDPIGSSSE